MKLIHEFIKEYAKRDPEKTAVSDSFQKISYGELDIRSRALAGRLKKAGLSRGGAAAIYLPYRGEMALAAVAVLRAGGLYVPFDEEYPLNRLEYMLKDSKTEVILTMREFWEEKKLDFPMDRVIFVEEATEPEEGYGDCEELTEDSPSMLLYTSGTTGQPKGVLHSHRMLQHITDYIRVNPEAAMNEKTVCGVMSSFPFIATQTFLMGPLLNGGRVCIVPGETRQDMGYLYSYIKEKGITHIFLPSSLAAILAEDYDTSGIFIFNGGEKLRNFRALSPDAFLINSYGCTETGGTLCKKIRGDEDRIIVGRPFEGTKTRVVDEDLKDLKEGEAGELLISCSFMSKGYYGLPELSAKKWVELDGQLWFRTGDRAIRTSEGDIDLLGRTDNMVKLRGFRIETGEVEAQISNAVKRSGYSDVGQIVVVVKNLGGSEHLSCYYEAPEKIDEKAVSEEIGAYLAPYMVPDVWVRMDGLPRNMNGKVMRNELPQPQRKGLTSGALDSEVLARLIYTASDVLRSDCVIGPYDRFTDVGGTSLSAMQYTAQLREQGIRLSSSDVLSLDNFKELEKKASVVYEQLWTREEAERTRKDYVNRGLRIEKILPISSEQDDMLFELLLDPESHSFQDLYMLQVESTLRREDLREALDVVAAEYEELRSSIVFRDVSVIQQAITDRSIPLEVTEMEDFGKEDREKLRISLMNEDFDPQFDSPMKVLCAHIDVKGRGMSCLYILTRRIALKKSRIRVYLARLMDLLSDRYPEDLSIRDWKIVLEEGGDEGDQEERSPLKKDLTLIKKESREIRVYSENDGPKMVFIHTGNTGSDAYYRLADRIRNEVSFAVIEPFNLYHPDRACYGIGNIAANYIRILKEHQKEGPYIIGGWCYGGIVAQEMACQLERTGEEVSHLFMLDSHAISNEKLRREGRSMFKGVNREYFETCPLFAQLRQNGMLEAMISNAEHVSEDILHHKPSFYHGYVTYFKPDVIPAGASKESRKYWEDMMEFAAGNFENYISRDKLNIIHTPHEHDLMMDDESLNIIVPEIYRVLGI